MQPSVQSQAVLAERRCSLFQWRPRGLHYTSLPSLPMPALPHFLSHSLSTTLSSPPLSAVLLSLQLHFKCPFLFLCFSSFLFHLFIYFVVVCCFGTKFKYRKRKQIQLSYKLKEKPTCVNFLIK